MHEMSESRRAALRQIEVQVIDYQDELESGERPLPSGIRSIQEAVTLHRQSLLEKVPQVC